MRSTLSTRLPRWSRSNRRTESASASRLCPGGRADGPRGRGDSCPWRGWPRRPRGDAWAQPGAAPASAAGATEAARMTTDGRKDDTVMAGTAGRARAYRVGGPAFLAARGERALTFPSPPSRGSSPAARGPRSGHGGAPRGGRERLLHQRPAGAGPVRAGTQHLAIAAPPGLAVEQTQDVAAEVAQRHALRQLRFRVGPQR